MWAGWGSRGDGAGGGSGEKRTHWGGKADRLREGLDLEMMGEGVEQDDLQVSS